MQEHDNHTPEAILRLKDTIVAGFRALPPEHQATMSIVLTKTVAEGEWGEWVRDALSRLYPPRQGEALFPVPTVTRGHLEQSGFTPEKGQFTDDDLFTMRSLMVEHYLNDVFLDEVTFIAELILERKMQQNARPNTP